MMTLLTNMVRTTTSLEDILKKAHADWAIKLVVIITLL